MTPYLTATLGARLWLKGCEHQGEVICIFEGKQEIQHLIDHLNTLQAFKPLDRNWMKIWANVASQHVWEGFLQVFHFLCVCMACDGWATCHGCILCLHTMEKAPAADTHWIQSGYDGWMGFMLLLAFPVIFLDYVTTSVKPPGINRGH